MSRRHCQRLRNFPSISTQLSGSSEQHPASAAKTGPPSLSKSATGQSAQSLSLHSWQAALRVKTVPVPQPMTPSPLLIGIERISNRNIPAPLSAEPSSAPLLWHHRFLSQPLPLCRHAAVRQFRAASHISFCYQPPHSAHQLPGEAPGLCSCTVHRRPSASRLTWIPCHTLPACCSLGLSRFW
jgi:hypothetical protein